MKFGNQDLSSLQYRKNPQNYSYNVATFERWIFGFYQGGEFFCQVGDTHTHTISTKKHERFFIRLLRLLRNLPSLKNQHVEIQGIPTGRNSAVTFFLPNKSSDPASPPRGKDLPGFPQKTKGVKPFKSNFKRKYHEILGFSTFKVLGFAENPL